MQETANEEDIPTQSPWSVEKLEMLSVKKKQKSREYG